MNYMISLDCINFTKIDIDSYLDYRESKPFDGLWMETYNTIEERLAKESSEVIKKLKKDNEMIREESFQTVYSATKNSDLAGYLSDDQGLIRYAQQLEVTDISFLNQMVKSYRDNSLPRLDK